MHGIFHKSDLSIDAVVKFFAAGFIIAAPTAFVFESLVMSIAALIYYTFDLILGILQVNVDFLEVIDYHFYALFGDILQAFLIAALIEELCKYYAFRTVEHPDLIFLTGLSRKKRDKTTTYGGNAEYAFSSDNNALRATDDSFESDFTVASSNSRRSHRGRSHSPRNKVRRMLSLSKEDTTEQQPDVRTSRQKAAAVTTAMISGAVGLACAETFIYVFFFGGSNAQEEITMLIFRSIFPIHALCAAIQSIGVIEKFLVSRDENSQTGSVGVGKILFPAVLLHGSFDAMLMIVNTVIDVAFENANNGGNGAPDMLLLNLIAAVFVLGVMISGLVWYYYKNRAQKSKLKLLEPITSNASGVRGDEENGIEML